MYCNGSALCTSNSKCRNWREEGELDLHRTDLKWPYVESAIFKLRGKPKTREGYFQCVTERKLPYKRITGTNIPGESNALRT